jgi:undecaprenyl-diphosphatase
MTVFEAIILGIIQGATEFLPVSSSGHSVLVPVVLGLPSPDLTAVVIAHLGTLVAVLIYFARDLWTLATAAVRGVIRRQPLADPNARLVWYLLVGTIPAAVAGFLLESWFDDVFAQPRWAAFFLLVTAGLLVTGERLLSGDRSVEELRWSDALIIGVFQMFALFPGISRSGSTIVGGLLRGLDRATAARYSFLLSIPVIFVAGLFQFVDLLGDGEAGASAAAYVALFLSAAAVGYGCIYFLLAWLRNRSLYPFAIYCVVFGLGFLLVSFLG